MSTKEFESKNSGAFCYVKLFSAIETRNGVERRRVIAWPRSINAAERKIAQHLDEIEHARVTFYSAADVRNTGASHMFATSLQEVLPAIRTTDQEVLGIQIQGKSV